VRHGAPKPGSSVNFLPIPDILQMSTVFAYR
jgi:hypothetical protein